VEFFKAKARNNLKLEISPQVYTNDGLNQIMPKYRQQTIYILEEGAPLPY
jgi:hypothetical protein